MRKDISNARLIQRLATERPFCSHTQKAYELIPENMKVHKNHYSVLATIYDLLNPLSKSELEKRIKTLEKRYNEDVSLLKRPQIDRNLRQLISRSIIENYKNIQHLKNQATDIKYQTNNKTLSTSQKRKIYELAYNLQKGHKYKEIHLLTTEEIKKPLQRRNLKPLLYFLGKTMNVNHSDDAIREWFRSSKKEILESKEENIPKLTLTKGKSSDSTTVHLLSDPVIFRIHITNYIGQNNDYISITPLISDYESKEISLEYIDTLAQDLLEGDLRPIKIINNGGIESLEAIDHYLMGTSEIRLNDLTLPIQPNILNFKTGLDVLTEFTYKIIEEKYDLSLDSSTFQTTSIDLPLHNSNLRFLLKALLNNNPGAILDYHKKTRILD